MMISGKVENWVVLIDLNNVGLSSLPISALKTIMVYLSSNYRSRMFVTYIANTPSSIYIPWSIVKSFLEEITIKKISFYKNSHLEFLYRHCNLS